MIEIESRKGSTCVYEFTGETDQVADTNVTGNALAVRVCWWTRSGNVDSVTVPWDLPGLNPGSVTNLL